MFLFPSIYDPQQHEILPSGIIGWIERIVAPADKKRWFLYRHKIHQTFVIGRWARDEYGVFTDFLNLGYSIGNFDNKMAMEFRRRLYAPITAADMSKAVTQAGRDQNSEVTDKNEAMKDIKLRYGGRKDIWAG